MKVHQRGLIACIVVAFNCSAPTCSVFVSQLCVCELALCLLVSSQNTNVAVSPAESKNKTSEYQYKNKPSEYMTESSESKQ